MFVDRCLGKFDQEVRDPIGEVPNFTVEEIEYMKTFGPRGLGKLFDEVLSLKQSTFK